MPDSPKVYNDATELLQVAELEGVRFFEMHARTKMDPDGGVDITSESAGSGHDDQQWTFFVQVNPEKINLRARLELDGPDAIYVVDAGVFFGIEKPGEVPKNVTFEFINRVAIMALYPFVREGLHELARKIDAKHPLLGLYHPGELTIDVDRAREVN